MPGLLDRLEWRVQIDVRRTDDIQIMMERARNKTKCELCESFRTTEHVYGMDVCQSCQKDLLPEERNRSRQFY